MQTGGEESRDRPGLAGGEDGPYPWDGLQLVPLGLCAGPMKWELVSVPEKEQQGAGSPCVCQLTTLDQKKPECQRKQNFQFKELPGDSTVKATYTKYCVPLESPAQTMAMQYRHWLLSCTIPSH